MRHQAADGGDGRAGRAGSETTGILRRFRRGAGWRPAEERLRQPQDGAPEANQRITEIESRLGRQLISEPDDARLTGGTRSLSRRLLGLNVLGLASSLTAKARRLPVPTVASVSAATVTGAGKLPAA